MNRFYNQFKHFFRLLFLIAISAFVLYFVPAVINRWFFLLLLIPIWISKNDYFWFAYLLLLLETPGGLFSGTSLDSPTSLPIYTLVPGSSTSFIELFVLLFLFKSFFKNNWYRYKSFVYRKQYRYLGILLIILLIVSFVLGVSSYYFVPIFRSLLPLSFCISTIFIFKNEEDIINFLKIIFPFAFIAILLQLYSLLNHEQFVTLFNPSVELTQGIVTGDEMRPIELGVVLFFCFFGSLLYLENKNKPFSYYYLLLINILSYISTIMTATRSWFLGFTIMYLLYFFLNYYRVGKTLIAFVTAIGFFLIIIYLIPQIGNQVNVSSKRLSTIEKLTSGDITAGGTMTRLTERGPRVMEGFKKSTIIFGAAFSDLYFEYSDGHVGYQNILLNTGAIGFLLFMWFAATLFFTPLRILKKISYRSDLRTILHNLPLLISGVLVINSATQFWGYNILMSRAMLLAFYFTISSVYIQAYQKKTSAMQ